MKSARSKSTTPKRQAILLPILLALAAGLICSAQFLAQNASLSLPDIKAVVARVNGAGITTGDLLEEMEQFYPANSAHGGIRPEKMSEIRSQALEELIVQELAFQQAVKSKTVVPKAEVRAEMRRLRAKDGAENFDRSLKFGGLSVEQYLNKLQRRMTLERLIRQKVVQPARLGPQALRDYYNRNAKKFQRPEQVHARLILVALDAQAKPQDVRQAQEKIDKVYRELQAGKDFAGLAEEYSDDFYRVKGGDLGWVHRGRLEPEFESVAFSLRPGECSKPFRTSYGFNLMKVEGREPARQMKFEDVRKALKAELEQKKMTQLRETLVSQLKKGAQIQIVEAASGPIAAH